MGCDCITVLTSTRRTFAIWTATSLPLFVVVLESRNDRADGGKGALRVLGVRAPARARGRPQFGTIRFCYAPGLCSAKISRF